MSMFIMYISVSVFRIQVNVFVDEQRKTRPALDTMLQCSKSGPCGNGYRPRSAFIYANERRAGTISPLSLAFRSDNNVRFVTGTHCSVCPSAG